jgi:hypothetical protein
MLDDMAGAEPSIRWEYRSKLERELAAPLDPVEREEWEREQWEKDAVAANEAAEATFAEWEGAVS